MVAEIKHVVKKGDTCNEIQKKEKTVNIFAT